MNDLRAFTISYDETRRAWALWTPDWPTTYHHSLRAARAHYYAAYRAHLADDAALATGSDASAARLAEGAVPEGQTPEANGGAQREEEGR